ncbi:hypothetical protein [Haladaptatus sp. NG-WS-4]
MRLTPRRILTTVLVSVLLIGGGTTVALADGQSSDEGVHEIGSQEITIRDATINVEDTHLKGPGLPDTTIQDQTYTVEESTTTIDGLTLSVNGETYEICRIEITVHDVGMTLDDVQLSSSS